MRTYQGNFSILIELKGWAGNGDLDSGGMVGISENAIGEAKAETVHGTGRWDAYFPISDSTGMVLHSGLSSRGQNVDGWSMIREVAQHIGAHGARVGKDIRCDDLAQVFEISLNAVHRSSVERFGHRVDGFLTGVVLND